MPEMMVRRLPVYLVLDTSGSMAGEPIEAVRQGVKALLMDLRNDPQAIETAYLSVITFANTAQQVTPLTELMSFPEPALQAGGTTSLGAALKLLDECIEREVRKSTASQKGDWKPLVFLMTDGQPTDTWEPAADQLKAKKVGNVIALAAGSAADPSILKRLTEIVVEAKSLSPDTLRQFFRWVSSSIKLTSSGIAKTADAPINLPPPPPQITIVP